MSTEERQDLLATVGSERRDLLKKIAIAAAFATPTIATFSLDSMRKKAFAQAAYEPPVVTGLDSIGGGRVVVTFSQEMNPGVGSDSSRGIVPCRWIQTTEGLAPNAVTWSGNNTMQVITYTGCINTLTDVHVMYNQPSCEAEKFVGANGLELVPYSGQIPFSYPC